MQKIINYLNTKRLGPLVFILFVTILVFSNIFSGAFVWDDRDFYENWPLLSNPDNIGKLLAGEVPFQHQGVYRPLRGVVQLMLFQTFGPHPFGYHVVSLLIHLGSVVAVYFVIEKMTKKRSLAFFTTLLFAVHPIHTESISYITTSIDVIGILEALWALYFYLVWRENHKIHHLVISSVLALVAFFSYEITLVLPVLILLIEWYKADFNYQSLATRAGKLWPYWLGVAVFIITRISVHTVNRSLTFDPTKSTLPIRILTMGKAIVKYIYLLFIPYPQNVFHQVDLSNSFANPKVFLSWFFIIAVVFITIAFAKHLRLISVGILWFFICLAPVSNIIPTGIIMAEKYMYLGSIGTCLILAVLAEKLIHNKQKTIAAIGIIVAVIITLAYGIATYQRNTAWASDAALWSATVKVRPNYGRVYNNLGFAYYQEKNYQKSLEQFLKARELEPKLPLVYHNLGNIYDELGDYKKSIENFQKAIELRSEYATYNAAETYNNLGTVYQKIGELDKALNIYEQSIEYDPTYFRAYTNKGMVLLAKNEYTAAQKAFQESLAISNNLALTHFGMAVTLVNLKKIDEAIPEYEITIQLDPTFSDPYLHLASIYDKQKQLPKAIAILQSAVTAIPDNADLHADLGILLVNAGERDKAIAELKEALRLSPNHEQARQILGQITK